MFSGIFGLALFVAGAGALFSLRGTAAGPHKLLRSPLVEEFATLAIVLVVVFGVMLIAYGVFSSVF